MLGIDIIKIKKIEEKFKKESFRKIFTEAEIDYCFSKRKPYEHLAGIFAAKEAFVKASNLNLSAIKNREIEIKVKKRPIIYYQGKKSDDVLSISHDDYAIAIVKKSTDNYFKEIEKPVVFPNRDIKSNKSDYGKILLIGGSESMAGSISMSAKAALRSGAGLVHVLTSKSVSGIVQIKLDEAMVHSYATYNFKDCDDYLEEFEKLLVKMDVVAIGPGMGSGNFFNFLKFIVDNFNGPIVIDADGINMLKSNVKIIKDKKNIILTPHEMEFSRISEYSIDHIKENRKSCAISFCKKYGVNLILKGYETIITDGKNTYINRLNTPALATAGSGDVLTGILAACSKRFMTQEAMRAAVYIHALSAIMANERYGEEAVLATDIIKFIPKAVKSMKEADNERYIFRN